MYRNILIFGHSNIGDVVYDLAVVSPLRRAYPDAKISFLTSALSADIAKGYKGLNRVIVFDRHKRDKSFIDRFRFTLGLRRERFDLVIVLSASLNYLFMGIPHVWRVKPKMRLKYKHPVDCYLYLLRLKGVPAERASFSFGVDEQDLNYCTELLRQRGVSSKDILVGISVLAGWSLKSWPIEKWNKLAEILKKRWQIKVVQLGKLPASGSGKDVGKKISESIIKVGDTSLSQVKGFLKHCQLFIGPDSSLLHLASCMGIDVIGLYGATSWKHFYPYLHQESIVLAENKLDCMPCCPGKQLSACSGQKKYIFGPCMERIRVEDVLEMVKEKLR